LPLEKQHIKVKAPGTKMVVDLIVPLKPKGGATMRIGTVNLGVLRRGVKKLRQSGKIHHIYILGKLPDGFGSIEEADEEPKQSGKEESMEPRNSKPTLHQ
jgi:hypothetical protein